MCHNLIFCHNIYTKSTALVTSPHLSDLDDSVWYIYGTHNKDTKQRQTKDANKGGWCFGIKQYHLRSHLDMFSHSATRTISDSLLSLFRLANSRAHFGVSSMEPGPPLYIQYSPLFPTHFSHFFPLSK